MVKEIIKKYGDEISAYYPEDMDMDLVIDDMVQENLCSAGTLISLMDYLYELGTVNSEHSNDEYRNILLAGELQLVKINKYALALGIEFDINAVESLLNTKAEELNLSDLSYYNKENLFTKLTSFIKFKNQGTLHSGIQKAIGGKDKITLDFVSIKEQLFNLMYFNTLMITSLRKNGTNDKNQIHYILDILLAIFSLNILLNINIEKDNG